MGEMTVRRPSARTTEGPFAAPARRCRVLRSSDLEKFLMRKRTRLVTTAGVTVLGFTAMSGMAQADTGGLGLSGLTSGVTKTLGGVVNRVAPTSKTASHDSSLNIPVHLPLKVPSTTRSTTSTRRSWARTEASRRGSLATADVNANVNARQVSANVGLCASLAEECGAQQSPPSQPPGQPPGQPPAQPPAANPPAATGSITAGGDNGSLPFTGGPIGSLAFLGALSVLTGAGAVGASRIRVRRES
jgi:hypothetical protein